jgi:hypothetical protein
MKRKLGGAVRALVTHAPNMIVRRVSAATITAKGCSQRFTFRLSHALLEWEEISGQYAVINLAVRLCA